MSKEERLNELIEPTGSDRVRVGNYYCIDGIKYMVTLVHLGEAILTSRCGNLRIEKCSWILSQNTEMDNGERNADNIKSTKD